MKIENFIEKKYIDNGLNLNKIGINEIAFNKIDTLKVLEELKKQNIAVLGGDVYYVKNNTIKLTYDNWFINQGNEQWQEYVKKSIKKAELYIKSYNSMGKTVYFTLVIRKM